jgi:hypothetical protein
VKQPKTTKKNKAKQKTQALARLSIGEQQNREQLTFERTPDQFDH